MPTTLPNGCHLALNRGDQIIDVLPLEQLFAQRVEGASPFGRRRVCLGVVAVAQLLDPALVLVALALDWRPCLLEPGPQLRLVAPRLTQLANRVELLVEREDFLEERWRYLDAAFVRLRRRKSFDGEQVLDARGRISQRPVRVIEVRRALEAGQPLGRGRVVEVVRVKLAAEIAEPALQIRGIEAKPARQAEKGEIVTVTRERENAVAVRAGVLVDRRTGATVAALEHRSGGQWRRSGSHGCE